MKEWDYIIVGAGVAGLTFADEMADRGDSILVIEKLPEAGGLTRSFVYKHSAGDFIFDIGPKRFSPDTEREEKFYLNSLDKDVHNVSNSKSIFLFGKFFSWPVTIGDIIKLPFAVGIRCFRDLVLQVLFDTKKEKRNFEEFIQSQYGKELFKLFFKGYTERFIGLDTKEVHKDWAVVGVNRSQSEKKASSSSMRSLFLGLFKSKKQEKKLYYPDKDGFSSFSKKLYQKCKMSGVEFLLDTSIQKIDLQHNELLLSSTEKISYKKIIWTGCLNDLGYNLGMKGIHFPYISTILFNFILSEEVSREDLWIYLSDTKMTGLRANLLSNYKGDLCPIGYSGISIELSCRENDQKWKYPEQLEALIRKDLINLNIIKNPDSIESVKIEKISNTYPIYNLEHREKFKDFFINLKEESKDIFLLGRTACYWYNNSNHSIMQAQSFSDFFKGKRDTYLTREEILYFNS